MADWDLNKAIGFEWEPFEVPVTKREIILYALGLGFQKDPLNKDHYNFTYEGAEEFTSFPTISVVLGHKFESFNIPGVPEFNPMMLLHGEESLEVFKEVEPDTTLVVTQKLIDLQDKKKAFVMIL